MTPTNAASQFFRIPDTHKVKILKLVFTLRVLSLGIMAAIILGLTISTVAQPAPDIILAQQPAMDHQAIATLTDNFKNLNAEHRLSSMEVIITQYADRLAAIEGTLKWLALGIVAVLIEAVLKAIIGNSYKIRSRTAE